MSNVIDALTENFAKLAAFLVLTLSFLVVYDSLNRYLFSGGSVSLQELEWHIFDIVFLLGLSYTLKHDAHVRVDIFYSQYSEKTKAIVNIISTLFLILPFIGIIIYVSYDYIGLSYNQNEVSADPGGLAYRYLIKSMMVIGFVLLGLQSISDLFKNIKVLQK